MKGSTTIGLHQNVDIYKNDILEYRGKNLVVETGRFFIAERMISAVPSVMGWMALGSASGFSANLVTNGDMELDANWNDYGSPTSNVRSLVQYHAGSYSRAFTTAGGADDGIYSDAFTTITDRDIFVRAWIYPTATTSCYVGIRRGDDDKFLYLQRWTGLTAGAWNSIDFTVLETSGGANAYICFFSDVADTIYIDDVEVYNSVLLSETTLQTEYHRQVLTSALRTGNYIEYIADWAAGIGTGDIREAGLFNDPVAGTMLSRLAFPSISKLTTDSLSIVWRVFVTSI